MAVAAVPGYGPITKANAPMIYRNREVYDKLSEDQKHLVDRYVPDEQKDEIDYEIRKTNGKQNGKNKIEDSKKADKHSGQGGNATATSVGMAAGAVGLVAVTKSGMKTTTTSGHIGLAVSIITLAGAVAMNLLAKTFDNGYKDRTSASDNAGNTNDTIDTQANALQASMDTMNEDAQKYLEDSKDLMKKTNDNNSKLADLQVQYADCQAAGDTAGAERLKGEIKQRHETKFDEEQEKLDETKQGIEDYRIMNDETAGVIEGGTNVADFLKEGTPLGVVAGVDAALLLVAAGYAAICIAGAAIGGAKDASHLDFVGLANGMVAAVIFTMATAMVGTSAVTMAGKAKKEFECGSNGRDMDGHVEALSKMKDAQSTYTDETEETYTEEDDERKETVEEGVEMANGNSTANRGPVITYKPYGQDDDDKDSNGKKKKGKNKAGAKA